MKRAAKVSGIVPRPVVLRMILVCLLLQGCGSLEEVRTSVLQPAEGPVVELALERVPLPSDAVTAGSAASDGAIWLLDGKHNRALVLSPSSGSWQVVPLVDESGRALLDPVSIDATGGLSLLVGDRALGRVYRYERNGALLDVRSVPDSGPGQDRGSLSGSRSGVQIGLGMLSAMAGERFAMVDDSATRLAIVDDATDEVRFRDLRLRAAAMAVDHGNLFLIDPQATEILVVGPHGALEGIMELPVREDGLQVADLAAGEGNLFVLMTDGRVWNIENREDLPLRSTMRVNRYRLSPSVVGEWHGLIVLPDALWWIGQAGVFRSARPRP